MHTFAAIDVGSNTIRLLIGSPEENRIAPIYSDRRITRLGNRVHQTGTLQDENMEHSVSVLREFSSVIAHYRVSHIKAVGTSALREAANATAFIEKVAVETGILIEVISGEQEAALTLKGILSSLTGFEHVLPDSMLIFDMGGGSTEWVFMPKNAGAEYTRSSFMMGTMPLGVLTLAQKHVTSDPVSAHDLNGISIEVDKALQVLETRIGEMITPHTCLIGTAGTFTTIAAVDLGLEQYSGEHIHLRRIPFNRLLAIRERLLILRLDDRKKVRGLEPARADLIIPGIQFTIMSMQRFRFDTLCVSEHGLLEGALLSAKEMHEKNISEAGKP